MGSGDEMVSICQWRRYARKTLSVRGLKNTYFVTISAYSATKSLPHLH